MFELQQSTSASWTDIVLNDFDSFLLDHALCERKASATGLGLVSRYPDKTKIISSLIEFAREELDHFYQVYQVLEQRNIQLISDTKSHYATAMNQLKRSKGKERFLDDLLIVGLIEARGCERLGMISKALPQGTLKDLYLELTRSESRHHSLFVRLAKQYFSEETIQKRIATLAIEESKIISTLPLRASMH